MFNSEKFIEESITKIKEQIGDKRAIIALSGGVDSATAAVLTSWAIGKNLVSVFVDTGFMRKSEPEFVKKIFEEEFHLNFRLIYARDEFFKALNGVTDPEKKREIIGHKFIEIFERVAVTENADFLVQGTIAPDWIETGGKIKSHHNVTLPHGMVLELTEPMYDLYKDEVRQVARALGLPEEISERMPFPGPGLAVRVIGDLTPERVEVVRRADAIVKEEIKDKIDPWQAFAVLLDGRATGVKGDSRDYGYLIAIRIVESLDAMTANAMNVEWGILKKISERITREIPEVTRVLYDLTDKPPATIEFE
ncbi:MAG: glutamine-hydrolyzing GMP synthase subunit GuaA [Candidatus Altiarchaeales archaeon HGW-Altiarchaeales-3]|nr:MAG: glutamine-hydrolyzing GMP synthase subunit GuaA [Candidatus Altiarchaeales archaeon HGW-Altiarchaeales-3]